jgi:hypothetical protein
MNSIIMILLGLLRPPATTDEILQGLGLIAFWADVTEIWKSCAVNWLQAI